MNHGSKYENMTKQMKKIAKKLEKDTATKMEKKKWRNYTKTPLQKMADNE